MLENSLSLILSVQDAERRLCERVHCLLDVLSDFTRRFEIIVIDDGSVDDTYAIAQELASRFPQVRAARHSAPRGEAGVLRTALEITTSDIIIMQDDRQPVRVQELHQLWKLRNDPYLLMARPRLLEDIAQDNRHGTHRLDTYHETVMEGSATRLLRRRAVERLGRLAGPGQRLVVDGLDKGPTRHPHQVPVRVRIAPPSPKP